MIKVKNRGFTLIELLVVISIISLLSSIILASLSEARVKAKDAALVQNLMQLNLALQLYLEDNGTPLNQTSPPSCGGYEIYGYCVITSYPSVLSGLVPEYISSTDFFQDLDWSILSDSKPVYIFNTDEFVSNHLPVSCGGVPFDEYEYLILFPERDSSRDIDLPFPETYYYTILNGDHGGSSYHCIGA